MSDLSLRAGPGPTYRPVPDIAGMLGVVVTKVHQMLRDRAVIGVRQDGVVKIPAEFVAAGDLVRGLTGTITLLTDAGYSDEEIISWLFDTDFAVPSGRAAGPQSSAIAELRSGRVKEVHRRAQVAGF